MEPESPIEEQLELSSVDTHIRDNSASQKKQQLEYINNMIRNARAYSIFYYEVCNFWRKIYWGTSFGNVFLVGVNTIISAIFNSCSTDTSVIRMNVILGSIVMSSISGLSFLNASVRQNNSESAADSYHKLAVSLYGDVYCSGEALSSEELQNVIVRYRTQLDGFIDRFEEPSYEAIQRISDSKEYTFLLEIHSQGKVTPHATDMS